MQSESKAWSEQKVRSAQKAQPDTKVQATRTAREKLHPLLEGIRHFKKRRKYAIIPGLVSPFSTNHSSSMLSRPCAAVHALLKHLERFSSFLGDGSPQAKKPASPLCARGKMLDREPSVRLIGVRQHRLYHGGALSYGSIQVKSTHGNCPSEIAPTMFCGTIVCVLVKHFDGGTLNRQWSAP